MRRVPRGTRVRASPLLASVLATLVVVVLLVATATASYAYDAAETTRSRGSATSAIDSNHHVVRGEDSAERRLLRGYDNPVNLACADARLNGYRSAPNTASGVRLRPGTTQSGVARTYDTALNPQGYIDDVASAHGINLRGSGQQINAVYNPNLVSAGRVRSAAPNVIEIGPLRISSSDELARTLAHELNHSRSFLRGGSAPEATAYGAEDKLSAWLRGGL